MKCPQTPYNACKAAQGIVIDRKPYGEFERLKTALNANYRQHSSWQKPLKQGKRDRNGKQPENAYCGGAALRLEDCAGRIGPDNLKRCSASSVGISLSWDILALFGVRSFDGQLIRLELVWFKWAYFHPGRVWRKWAQQIKLDKIGQCVFVYGKQAQAAQYCREKGAANKALSRLAI